MTTAEKIERKEAFVERVLNRVLSEREEREAREFAMLSERVKDLERQLAPEWSRLVDKSR